MVNEPFPPSSSAQLNRQLFPFDAFEAGADAGSDAPASPIASLLAECTLPVVRLLVRQPFVVSHVLLLAQYKPHRDGRQGFSGEQRRRAQSASVEQEEASQQQRLQAAESYLLYASPPSSILPSRLGSSPATAEVNKDSLGYITATITGDRDESIDVDLAAAANPLSRLFYLGASSGCGLALFWRGLWTSSLYQLSRSFLLSRLTALVLEQHSEGPWGQDEVGTMRLGFATALRLSFCHIAVHWLLSPLDCAMTREIVYSQYPQSFLPSLSLSLSALGFGLGWRHDVKLTLVYHCLFPLFRYLPFAALEPSLLVKWSFDCLYYLVSMPFETLLVRSHAQEKRAPLREQALPSVVRLRKLHYPRSMAASFATIVREEGVASLYRGLGWRLFSLSMRTLLEWIRDLDFEHED